MKGIDFGTGHDLENVEDLCPAICNMIKNHALKHLRIKKE